MSSGRSLRIGLCQWNATRDIDSNVSKAITAIAECAAGGAQVVLIPENGLMLGSNAEMRAAAFRVGGVHIRRISAAAREHGVVLVLGGLKHESAEGVHNSALVIGRDGEVGARYDKIHLFDAVIDGQSFEASNVELPGDRPVMVTVDGVNVGLTICYDLRFPELYRQLALSGSEVIVVPAAFTRTTGKAHWEVLLRARAIENACFVVASATVHSEDPADDAFETYGHAMVVDPWGTVLANLGEASFACQVVHLDLDQVTAVRRKLPVLRGVRPEAYLSDVANPNIA